MDFLNDIGAFLTGHDGKKEGELLANEKLIKEVVSCLESMKTKEVETAKNEVIDALNELNNVPGVKEYLGGVPTNGYENLFDEISTQLDSVGKMINSKYEDIKEYNNIDDIGDIFARVGSTITMGGAKIGEGALSVLENIGDGAMSVIGWGAGGIAEFIGDKETAQGIHQFWADKIKANRSHDFFNFYYDSDFAKLSAITEDSALATACEIGGATAGYLFLGGVAAAGWGISATAANTGVALIGGLGTGTEGGLLEGKDYNDAFAQGVTDGVVQGTIALVAGKIGEHLQKKSLSKELTEAKDELTEASKAVKDADKVFAKSDKALQNATDELEQGIAKHDLLEKYKTDLVDSGEYGKKMKSYKQAKNAYNQQEQVLKDLYKRKYTLGETGLETQIDDAEKVLKGLGESLNTEKELVDHMRSLGNTISSQSPTTKEMEVLKKNVTTATTKKVGSEQALSLAKGTESKAKIAVDEVQAKINGITAFDDPITKAGQTFGEHPIQTIKTGISDVGTAIKGAPKTISTAVIEAPKTISTAVKGIPGAIREAPKAAVTAVASGVAPIVSGTGLGTAAVAGDVLFRKIREDKINNTTKGVGTINTDVDKKDYKLDKSSLKDGVGIVVEGTSTRTSEQSLGGGNNSGGASPSVGGNYSSGGGNYTGGGNNYSGGGNSSSGGNSQKETTSQNETQTPVQDTNTSEQQFRRDDDTQTIPTDTTSSVYDEYETYYEPTNTTSTESGNNTPDKEDPIQTVTPTGDTTQTTTTTTPQQTTTDTTTTTEPQTTAEQTTTQDSPQTTTEFTTTTNPTEETQHSGGGYSESSGYSGYGGGYNNYTGTSSYSAPENGLEEPTLEAETPNIENLPEDASTSVEDIIKGKKYSKIPTSTSAITPTKTKTKGNAVIPIAAGLSAAAAAGIGAKAYIDRKNNSKNGEDDTYTEEWEEDDTINDSYNESSDNIKSLEEKLYEYDENEENTEDIQVEKYGARKTEELADLQ